MSGELLDRKLANIARTGARIVATGNPGCSVQLEAGARNVRFAGVLPVLSRCRHQRTIATAATAIAA